MEPGDIVTYGFYDDIGIVVKIIRLDSAMIVSLANSDYLLFRITRVEQLINYK